MAAAKSAGRKTAKKTAAKKSPGKPSRPAGSKPSAQQKDDAATLLAFSDQLLAEIDGDVDMPKLVDLHQMGRRPRAQLMTVIQGIMPRVLDMEKVLAASTNDLDLPFGDLMMMVADVEDALANCAVDRDAFLAWAGEVDDRTMLALFARFVATVTSGEAPRSSR